MEQEIESLKGNIEGVTKLLYSVLMTMPLEHRESLLAYLQPQVFDMDSLPAGQPAIPLLKIQSNEVLKNACSFLVALKEREQNGPPDQRG